MLPCLMGFPYRTLGLLLLNLTTTERQQELDPCAAHIIYHVLLATIRAARGASIGEGSSGHTDDIDE